MEEVSTQSIKDAVIAATGLTRKDHGVITIVISHSFGMINGILAHEEDAMSPEEVAYKHEAISDGVINGLWGDKGSPGTVRKLKDEFVEGMAAAGGDLQKAMENAPWKGPKPGKAEVPEAREDKVPPGQIR